MLPQITLSEVEEMSLLDIDKTLEFLIGVKRDNHKGFLKDLSCLIFYGVNYGYSAARSKKNIEKTFHKQIDKLIGISQEAKSDLDNPAKDWEKFK